MNPQDPNQRPQPTPTPAPQPQAAVPPAQPAAPIVSPATPVTDTTAPVGPRKSRFPKWLRIVFIVLGVIIVFIVAIFLFVGNATKDAQKVSDQFVNDVQAGNTESAYALTSDSFRKATSQDQLQQLIEQAGPLLKGDEKITDRSVQKSTGAPETVVLVYTDKTSSATYYIRVQLEKNDNQWQVSGFRSDDKPLSTDLE
jgi:uncharacterized protein YpmB